jgi:hypothetical protein
MRLGAAESQEKNEHPTDMATRSRGLGRLYSPDKRTANSAFGAVPAHDQALACPCGVCLAAGNLLDCQPA